jgi:hypothetical protein
VPKAGNYGTRLSNNSFQFTMCPLGFCVESNGGKGEQTAGPSYAQCAKGANRDWAVPLCGACLPGYSQSISNANCVPDTACSSSDFWFWPASLLYCALYAIYFLWSSTPATTGVEEKRQLPSEASADNAREALGTPGDDYKDAEEVELSPLDALRRSRAGQALGGGSITVIMFFFQMAGLVLPLKGMAADLGANLKSFFGMQLGGDSSGSAGSDTNGGGGFCLWAGMDAQAKVEMRYAIPLTMAVVLLIVARVGGTLLRGTWCGKITICPDSLRARLPGAYAQLLLLAYATISMTTLNLLDCATMPTGKRVLFIAGATECGMWQAPLFMLLVLLVLLPTAPLLVYCGRRLLPPTWRLAARAQAARFPTHPAALALRNSLTNAHVAEYWHWPALLALQRFLMVAAPIFATGLLTASIAQAFIALCMLTLQLSLAPFTNDDVNQHQQLASFCLLALAVLNIPQRALAQASVDLNSPLEHALKAMCDHAEGAMGFFLLAPVLLPLSWALQAGHGCVCAVFGAGVSLRQRAMNDVGGAITIGSDLLAPLTGGS